jgi:hypothetical protein
LTVAETVEGRILTASDLDPLRISAYTSRADLYPSFSWKQMQETKRDLAAAILAGQKVKSTLNLHEMMGKCWGNLWQAHH